MRKLCLVLLLLSLQFLVFATSANAQSPQTRTVTPPTTCHVTKPNGRKLPWQTFEGPGQRPSEFWEYNEWHGNKAVSTFLPRNGVLLFQPGRNITLEDGSIATKFLWFKVRKPMSLAGRRLDATAPPLRVAVPDEYGDALFQPSQAIFPTPGCWQITSRVGRDSLKFTLWIVFERPSGSLGSGRL